MTARDPTVAIIGSRNYPNPQHPRTFVQKLASKYPGAVVVSGGASGVDQTAEHTANEHGLGVISYQPREIHAGGYTIVETVVNERARYLLGETAIGYCEVLAQGTWPTHKEALLARNTMIVDTADQIVAFWTKWSRGTLHAINYAHTNRKPVHINPEGNP